MVDVITPTKTFFAHGRTPAMIITFTGFDGDGEYGIFDSWSEGLDWVPSGAVAVFTTTAGTGAAIDLDVNVSLDGTNYVATTINNITSANTYEYTPTPDWGEPDATSHTKWRYWKVIFVAVGTGNTNTVELYLFK